MSFVDVIVRKRDGHPLSRTQIDEFVTGLLDDRIPDYQASALLMAIVFRGMNAEETSWLTDAMLRSGERVDLSDIPGIKVGKHSTGGVGDKVSIVLAPVAAACGVIVPKMSGRGLGSRWCKRRCDPAWHQADDAQLPHESTRYRAQTLIALTRNHFLRGRDLVNSEISLPIPTGDLIASY
jgi:hypothetical protein